MDYKKKYLKYKNKYLNAKKLYGGVDSGDSSNSVISESCSFKIFNKNLDEIEKTEENFLAKSERIKTVIDKLKTDLATEYESIESFLFRRDLNDDNCYLIETYKQIYEKINTLLDEYDMLRIQTYDSEKDFIQQINERLKLNFEINSLKATNDALKEFAPNNGALWIKKNNEKITKHSEQLKQLNDTISQLKKFLIELNDKLLTKREEIKTSEQKYKDSIKELNNREQLDHDFVTYFNSNSNPDNDNKEQLDHDFVTYFNSNSNPGEINRDDRAKKQKINLN